MERLMAGSWQAHGQARAREEGEDEDEGPADGRREQRELLERTTHRETDLKRELYYLELLECSEGGSK